MLTALVYLRAFGSHFLDDTISWMYFYKQDGWSTFYTSFDFTSMYYGHDVIFNLLYVIFGTHALPWFLILIGVHTANAYFGYTLFAKIFENKQIAHGRLAALCGTVLFLLSPHQTENVVWGATLHYGSSMLMLWGGFRLYGKFLAQHRYIYLALFYLLFLIALTTLEIALVFPGLFFIVFAFLWHKDFTWRNIWECCRYIALPMAALLLLYFVANKYVHGSFIGHYGEEHTKTLFTMQSLSTMLQYFAKHLFYIHFFNYATRDAIYSVLSNPMMPVAVIAAGIILTFLLAKKYPGIKMHIYIVWTIFILCSITLIPVCSMYFMYLNQVQNDRLGYFFSMFLFMLFALVLSVTGKRMLIATGAVIIILDIFLLQDITARWKHAAQIQETALETFSWQHAETVYVLNQPCYFNGVYIFRNDMRIDRSLSVLKDIDMYGQIEEIAWTNMYSLLDDVIVKQVDTLSVQVTLSDWGRWFWVNDQGAQDYSNDTVQVDFDALNHSYTAHFVRPPGKNDVVLYFTPGGWKVFTFQ
jgi:hypothetical protein